MQCNSTSLLNFANSVGEKIRLYPASVSYGLGITNGTINMYGDTNSDVALGTNGFTGFTEILRCIGSDKSVRIGTGDLNVFKNQTNTGNLTISGTLQSPMTSLLAVSSSVMDVKLNTGIIGNFWGTTATSKQINTGDNILINSGGSNSYLQFRNNGTSTNAIMGLVGDVLVARISDSNSFKIQSTAAADVMTCDNSGNVVVAGSFTSSGAVDATGNSVLRGTDPLQLTNSGSSNFKQTGGSYTKRYEQQSGGDYKMWDEGNNEIYHISTDRQMWWQGDFNVAGTYYDSGLPLTPSSKKIKENIRDLPDNKILDKIEFKQYTKTYKNKTYDEVGVIIEDLEQIEGIENYDLVHTRKGGGEEFDGLKYLKYVTFFMILHKEQIDRIKELEKFKEDIITCKTCKCLIYKIELDRT